MLHLATGDEAVVPEEALQEAMHKLLEQIAVQDVFTDSPKATDWVSTACCLDPLSSSVLARIGKDACRFNDKQQPEGH